MRKNQGYRAAGLRTRTNATGTKLAITYGKHTTVLSEAAAHELCMWLISLFEIDAAMKREAIRDLEGFSFRIERAVRMLDDLLANPVAMAAGAAQAAVSAGVKAGVAAHQDRIAKSAPPKAKRRRKAARKPK